MFGCGSQLSVAVGEAAVGIESHCTVTSAGTPLKTGAVESVPVICWLALLVLPHTSVATQVRTITKCPGIAPFVDVSLNEIVGCKSQLSVAVGFATAGMSLHCVVVLAGIPLNTGAVVSVTVICCVRELLLPQASVAVHVRVKT